MYVDINYKGETLTVEGDLIKGSAATYSHPGDPDEFEVEHVWYEDIDIFPFVDMVEIEQLTLENIEL